MLIRKPILEQIKLGEVTLAFRRWTRPNVRTGTLKTAVGVLVIQLVEKTGERKISESDAHRAGYPGSDALIKDLTSRKGDIYRITLRFIGEDPRIKLFQVDKLSDLEFTEIHQQMQRLDSMSRVGNWTLSVLTAIKECFLQQSLRLKPDLKRTGFK